jgi:hypothetical protein
MLKLDRLHTHSHADPLEKGLWLDLKCCGLKDRDGVVQRYGSGENAVESVEGPYGAEQMN